ncbi:uncharacterized protein LOC121879210 [Homarus americanus]|uniref:uncharacterized protein LOC121879210 n=1 Tax=Homarus americanus TaxID=6706 RepID=UPI001C485FB5|nr:uncharacterized protein LOC121879210 [Homarus americanus]
MRLLPVWVLAVVGWVAAATPGPRLHHTSQEDQNLGPAIRDVTSPKHTPADDEDLGPALLTLARRKRANIKANLPYSNYRPSGGIHRYRYPLYRKRSYQPQPQYDYESRVMLPELAEDYQEYDDYPKVPSLFRERNIQQQQDRKKKELLLEDDGYFSDDYVPEKGSLSPSREPLTEKDYLYHLYNMPFLRPGAS